MFGKWCFTHCVSCELSHDVVAVITFLRAVEKLCMVAEPDVLIRFGYDDCSLGDVDAVSKGLFT